MKVSKRETVLLIVLFVLICGFLYNKFFFVPIYNEITDLNQEIGVLTNDLKEIKIKQSAVEKLKVTVDELQAEAEIKLKDMMKTIDQPEMLVMISHQLDTLSSHSVYMFPREYEELNNCRIYTVRVQFMTDYSSFKQILSRLSNVPNVNRVVIGSLENEKTIENSPYNVQADISVEFLIQDEGEFSNSYSFITGTYPNTNLFL